MKTIASVKLTKGYDHWKKCIESNHYKTIRENYGINFIGYGIHEESGRVYIVEDNDSPDAPQKMFDAHPTYADEVGIDPSTVIFISLEG